MKYSLILAFGLALILPLHAGNKNPGCQNKAKHNLSKVFKKKDKDNDGFLTKDEFIAKAKNADKAAKAFTKKDKNSDGKLSRAEFTGKKDKAGAKNKAAKKQKAAKKGKGQAKKKNGKKHP